MENFLLAGTLDHVESECIWPWGSPHTVVWALSVGRERLGWEQAKQQQQEGEEEEEEIGRAHV